MATSYLRVTGREVQEKTPSETRCRDAHANRWRWDCSRDGCFNLNARFPIWMLDTALPVPAFKFGDIDGIVEINDHLCVLESKTRGAAISKGQHLLFKSISKSEGNAVYLFHGEPDGAVYDFTLYQDGEVYENCGSGIEQLCDCISQWSTWAYKRRFQPDRPLEIFKPRAMQPH